MTNSAETPPPKRKVYFHQRTRETDREWGAADWHRRLDLYSLSTRILFILSVAQEKNFDHNQLRKGCNACCIHASMLIGNIERDPQKASMEQKRLS